MQQGQRIKESVRQAIIADLALGMSQSQVARKFDVNRQSVGRIKLAFTREHGSIAERLKEDWRTRIVSKSIKSVERALDDHTDSYKSAHIGVASLKGLGVFTEQQMVGIHVLMESMPGDLKEIDVSETRVDSGSEKD
jgi:transposase-like protein